MTDHDLHSLFEALRPSWGKNGEVEFYEQLAQRLSKIARKDRPWSWRYVQSVDHGTLAPSRQFLRAGQLLAAALDGMPTFIAETEPVRVHARPGSVHPDSIVMGGSKPCENPGCTIHFIPRVPWQKFCPRCAGLKRRKT